MAYTFADLGTTAPLMLFTPDWKTPLSEDFEWKTTVARAYDGTEQRRAARLAPRRSMTYSMLLSGRDAAAYRNTLAGLFSSPVAVPLWTDSVRLTADRAIGATSLAVSATAVVRLGEGLGLLLFKSRTEYEIVEAASIGASTITLEDPLTLAWPAGTRVYPLVVTWLPHEVPVEQITDGVLRSGLTLTPDPVSCPVTTATGSASETYNGYEVLTTQPNWVRSVGYDLSSTGLVVDFGTGAIERFETEPYSRFARRYSWTLNGKAEINAFRQFLNRCRGMAKPFYAPTWSEDFRVVEASVDDEQLYLDVQENAFEEHVGVDLTRNRVLIRMRGGVTEYRRITAVSDQGNGVTRLSLDATLGVAFTPADFVGVHLLNLCRLATDKVTFTWETSTVATVETNLITVKE